MHIYIIYLFIYITYIYIYIYNPIEKNKLRKTYKIKKPIQSDSKIIGKSKNVTHTDILYSTDLETTKQKLT